MDATGFAVELFDAKTGASLGEVRQTLGYQSGLSWSPDGARLFGAGPMNGGTFIAGWQMDSLAPLAPLKLSLHAVAVTFAPDGKDVFLAGAMREGGPSFSAVDLASLSERRRVAGPVAPGAIAVSGTTVALAANAVELVDPTPRVTLSLRDRATLALRRSLPVPEGLESVQGLAFSPNGKELAATADGHLVVWQAPNWSVKFDVRNPDAALGRHVAWSPDGAFVLTSGHELLANRSSDGELVARRELGGPLGAIDIVVGRQWATAVRARITPGLR